MNKILIVEDEPPISNLIAMNLKQAGYECTAVFDGSQAADLIAPGAFDLILLDVMLPKVDGFELMEYIRPMEIPVIFITAKADLSDRVKGLRLGADDYITKPFEIAELLARVESVLRRYRKTERVIHIQDVEIDTDSRTVRKNNVQIELTMKEYELLLLFVRNLNVACSGKPSMSGYGAAVIWEKPALLTCMYSAFAASWDGRIIWWLFTKWDTGWSLEQEENHEICLESLFFHHHSCNAGIWDWRNHADFSFIPKFP